MRNKKLGKLEEKKSVMEDLERKISATTVEDDVFRAVQKDSDDDVVLSQSEKRLVDLSQEWEIDRAFESNPGARWCERVFAQDSDVNRVTVIENGKLVVDYRGKGEGLDDIHHLFSTTKSVISMLVGAVMRHAGVDLKVTHTLGEIFPDEWAWQKLDGNERAYKKALRLEEILTMTSGLVSNTGGRRGIINMKDVSMADAAGSDLPRALEAPAWNPKLRGKFHYMPMSNILSYVIKQKTGLSPREFGDKYVFPKLGIHHSKMDWDSNAEGIQTSYSNLQLTTRQMCKIGQLFLQDGYSAPGSSNSVISEEWVRTTHSKHVPYTDTYGSYGYLWGCYDRDYHGIQTLGDVWVAPGMFGQLIAVSRETNRVCAVSRFPTPILGEALVEHKVRCIKLLGKTLCYQSHRDKLCRDINIPEPYIKIYGKLVRNPEYTAYMANKASSGE